MSRWRKSTATFKELWRLAREAVREWSADDAATHAAALAYCTIFSIAPTLIIAIAAAGLLFEPDDARGAIQAQVRDMVGDSGAQVIEDMVSSTTAKPAANVITTIVGIVVLVFGATGVFAALRNALNRIWGVTTPVSSGILGNLRNRVLSFAMVLAVGFLLLVSLVLSAGLASLGARIGSSIEGWVVLAMALNLLVSFAVVTVLFALIYKILPDLRIAWRDVWLGAAVTSLLFSVGKALIGLYLGRSAVASSYGAAGSLVVLLLWVYYSAMILLLGAEFTQVYARTYGSLRHEASRLNPPAAPAPSSRAPSAAQ